MSEFLKAVSLRLRQHVLLFGHLPHPVVGVFECIHRFDGHLWQQLQDTHHMYLDLSPKCLVILVRHKEEGFQDLVGIDSKGWAYGRLVAMDGDINRGWFPYSFVELMRPWYFCSVEDLSLTLVPTFFPDM